MEVYFSSSKLEKNCCEEKACIRTYGAKMSRILKRRLMELKAAEVLDDVSRILPTKCHELKQNRKGYFSVDLVHPKRLIFIPADDPVPYRDDGGLDWDNIREIEIIEITDTHDGKNKK